MGIDQSGSGVVLHADHLGRCVCVVCVSVCMCVCTHTVHVPTVLFQSTSAEEVQNIGVGSAMRRSLLFGSKSTHSMPQEATSQDHPDVCASLQKEEESAGAERGEEDRAAQVEEGADVDEVVQSSVGKLAVHCSGGD